MLSLAAWKYRRVLFEDGGPIEQISVRKQEIRPGVIGYEALAYLREDLREKCETYSVYGNPDGTGSAHYRYDAAHVAISEALERWAFYVLRNGSCASNFYFDLEPTTTGMAAFPGFFASSVSTRARYEAIERWSLCSWWEGRLSARRVLLEQDGHSAVELLTPWMPTTSTVLLWGPVGVLDCVTYGFATASSLKLALERAWIEKFRNDAVLKAFVGRKEIKDITHLVSTVTLTQEKRFLFFSSRPGHAKFLERIVDSINTPLAHCIKPRILFDAEILGEWSRYTTVWRCVLEPISDRRLGQASDYFLF